MTRAAAALMLLSCAGCFSARGGAEGFHRRVRIDMEREELLRAIGKPREVVPIPGQGDAPALAVEQWRYWWTYRTGRVLTAFVTLGIGLLFMDKEPYGFDVGIGRDGRVRAVTDVAPPK